MLTTDPTSVSHLFATPRRISDLEDLLHRKQRILDLVVSEAEELAAKFGTPRRTAIITDGGWCECRGEG